MAPTETAQSQSEVAVTDSLRISYYYSYIHDVPLETWLRFGETLTIHDGGGCDIARCEVAEDGHMRAYNLDCASTGTGTYGPWIYSGCSRAIEFGYTVQCCILHLQLGMTGSHTVVDTPGTVITYSYSVSNVGADMLTNLTVTDDRLGAVDLSDLAVDGKGTLAPGHTESGTLQYAVKLSDLQSGMPITNTATATTDQSDAVTSEWSVDTVAPTLSLMMKGSHRVVEAAGTTVTYTYEVTNTSAFSLTDVAVQDDLLGPVTLTDVASDGAGVLAPRDSASGTLQYVVTQADVDAGTNIRNVATATSAETDPIVDEWTISFSSSLIETKLVSSTGIQGSHGLGCGTTMDGDFIASIPCACSPPCTNFGHPMNVYVFQKVGTQWWKGVRESVLQLTGVPPDYGFVSHAFTMRLPYLFVSVYDQSFDGGQVHVFRFDGESWNQTQILRKDGTNRFGFSLAASHDVLVIGEDNGNTRIVFRLNEDIWQPAATLSPPGGGLDFGMHGAAVWGNVIVVAEEHGDGYLGGPAHVFRDAGADRWEHEQRLDYPVYEEQSENSGFGRSVVMNESGLAIGAPDDQEGGNGAGAIFIYEDTGTGYTLTQKIRSPLELNRWGFNGAHMGNAMALSGNLLAVAVDYSEYEGVLLYQHGDNGWVPLAPVRSVDPARSDSWGNYWMPALDANQSVLVVPDVLNSALYVFENLPVTPVDVEPVSHHVPQKYSLAPNYPNPFGRATMITFEIPRVSDVTLSVYDLLGRKVKVLASGVHVAGTHRVTFDAVGLPSGLYMARLETEVGSFTRQMVLVR